MLLPSLLDLGSNLQSQRNEAQDLVGLLAAVLTACCLTAVQLGRMRIDCQSYGAILQRFGVIAEAGGSLCHGEVDWGTDRWVVWIEFKQLAKFALDAGQITFCARLLD